MAVHTEIDVLNFVELPRDIINKITHFANIDCMDKIREFDKKFDINDVNINVDYELICRVRITPAI